MMMSDGRGMQVNDDFDVEDGWGSDLDIDEDSDVNDDNDNIMIKTVVEENDHRVKTPIITNRKVVSTSLDDSLVLTAAQPSVPTTTSNGDDIPIITNDGWDDDDDDLDIDDSDAPTNDVETPNVAYTNQSTTMLHPTRTKYSKLEYDIHDYIVSIPVRRIEHLQRLLQQHYNTPIKAMELYHYYASRPQLLQYTIDKELLRLKYTVITTTTNNVDEQQQQRVVIQEKEQIRNILMSLVQSHEGTESSSTVTASSIFGRCANQSILADMLQAMSSSSSPPIPQQQQQNFPSSHSNDDSDDHNMVLLPSKFMCTAMASQCHFTIDFIDSTIHVDASFHISIPILNQRWNIGQLQTSILFSCCPNNSNTTGSSSKQPSPTVDFTVGKYTPLVNVTCHNLDDVTDIAYRTNLHQCATTIQELSMNDDAMELLASSSSPINQHPTQQHNESQNSNATVLRTMTSFRDAYVQDLLVSTGDVVVDGMKSAWQDFDTATGLVTKFKQLPSLLPSIVDDPTSYNDVYDGQYTSTLQNYGEQRQQHVVGVADRSNTMPPDHYLSKQPTPQQQKPQNRPTSLLGGFVRSLAQSVTLPQEDPSIYEDWQQRNDIRQQPPMQWAPPSSAVAMTETAGCVQVDATTLSIPRLYNIDTPTNTNTTTVSSNINRGTTIPHLYNITRDEQVKHQRNSDTFFNNQHNVMKTLPIDHPIRDEVQSNVNSRLPKEKMEEGRPHEQQEGWDDDIDVDDLDVSWDDADPSNCIRVDEPATANNSTTEPSPIDSGVTVIATNQCSDDVPRDWVYDPVTDIIPTRTRYTNPIGGSRSLRYC